MVTPSDFDWCQIVTVAGTENNRRGTQTHSQPAQKNGADYWCRLLPLPSLYILYLMWLEPF
jgi:hypothetical protein